MTSRQSQNHHSHSNPSLLLSRYPNCFDKNIRLPTTSTTSRKRMSDIIQNKCKLCDFSNLSCAHLCEKCQMGVLPTLASDNKRIKWEVYTFGKIRAPGPEIDRNSLYNGVEILKTFKHSSTAFGHTAVAICVADNFLLTHYPAGLMRYTWKRAGPGVVKIARFSLGENLDQMYQDMDGLFRGGYLLTVRSNHIFMILPLI